MRKILSALGSLLGFGSQRTAVAGVGSAPPMGAPPPAAVPAARPPARATEPPRDAATAAPQRVELAEPPRPAAKKESSLVVNGRTVPIRTEGRTLLVHFLREDCGLTGTHVGCDTSQCGACVVHLDGEAVKSCTVLAHQAAGSSVLTIEGLADGSGAGAGAGADGLHPMQAAFRAHHGLQCGFCTPGMIMAAVDMVRRHPGGLDEAAVRHELEGNICRCTGYHNIVKAVLAGAEAMGAQDRAKAA